MQQETKRQKIQTRFVCFNKSGLRQNLMICCRLQGRSSRSNFKHLLMTTGEQMQPRDALVKGSQKRREIHREKTLEALETLASALGSVLE